MDKIDISGLTILLRQVMQQPGNGQLSSQLQGQLRSISDYLMQYDRIIVGQARQRIVAFQRTVIGALGLIISLASISLVLLYRNTVSPLLQLSKIARDSDFREAPNGSLGISSPVVDEVADLIKAIEELLARNSQNGDSSQGQSVGILVGEAVNETTNRLNGIINYAQLLYDSLDDGQESRQQRELLQKIIDSGYQITEKWQKLVEERR